MSNPSASPTTQFPSQSNAEQRVTALRSIDELDGLTPEELRWIANAGTERSAQDGELIFSQQAPPNRLIFVLAGQVVIKRHTSSPVTVLTGRTGRITGKTPYSRTEAWNADGRALGEVWLLEIHESRFQDLLKAIPSMTERIVRVLLDRNREYTRAEEQIGKLSALSKLAGNLAHELNNPASAARSAGQSLHSKLAGDDTRYRLGQAFADQTALSFYLEGLEVMRHWVVARGEQGMSASSGQEEEEIGDWLRTRNFKDGWALASILAESGLTIPQLEKFLSPVPPELVPLALHDLLSTLSCDAAIASVVQACGRIFRIVSAVKDYSYMDRKPLQVIELSRAFDDVLMTFQARLKQVHVKKDISLHLPHLVGLGSELNQAFSALIENALDAMEDKGILILSAKQQDNTLVIRVGDNGHGIPREYQDRVFEPFFTTKAFGQGLGLGLDTVQRVVMKHLGTVSFETCEEGTAFQIRLPLDRTEIF